MAKPNTSHHTAMGLSELLIFLFIVLVAMGMVAPYYIQQHKTQKIDQENFQSTIVEDSSEVSTYAPFWYYYDNIVRQRADTDGNGIISAAEAKNFETAFFDPLELKIEPNTKVIRKKDGTLANVPAMICRLRSFYLDKGYIKPVCDAL